MKVLIPVPQYQYIFGWTVVNSSGLVKLLNDLTALNGVEVILKFHPRHGRVEYYEDVVDLSNFRVEDGDNYLELLELADIVVAFESSTTLIDSIIGAKPLIYISDYIEQFRDENVYNELISNLKLVKMNNLPEILTKLERKDLNINMFLPRINVHDVFYKTGDTAGKALACEIAKILDNDQGI